MTNEGTMEDPSSSSCSCSRERWTEFMEDKCCTQFCIGPNPSMARYVYGLIFLLTCLLAWTSRDYGHTTLSELKQLKACEGLHYCLGAEGVLRISFGGFTFFFVMFLSTVGTKKLNDPRSSWHSEWWPAKIFMWISLMAIPFLAPSSYIQLYGKIAHFGAGAFLLIQLISAISFITWLNDCFRPEKNTERSPIQVLVISIAAFVACLVGIVLMYILYAPNASCKSNIIFITLTLVLLPLMTVVSVHSKVKAGILAPGLMGMYIVFLCWSAIRSEPQTESCNQKAATHADWLTIVSFVIALIVIVTSTFSTGKNSKSFQFKKTGAESEDDVPYGYGFFHFVFAMGAMYFAMLFIGWDRHHIMQKWTIDVGWASTWVRIVNEWLATLVYMWMLVAPLVWKSRRPSMHEVPVETGEENEKVVFAGIRLVPSTDSNEKTTSSTSHSQVVGFKVALEEEDGAIHKHEKTGEDKGSESGDLVNELNGTGENNKKSEDKSHIPDAEDNNKVKSDADQAATQSVETHKEAENVGKETNKEARDEINIVLCIVFFLFATSAIS